MAISTIPEPQGAIVQAKLYKPAVISAFALTDTNPHDMTTSDTAIQAASFLFHPGKKLLYYDSTLNQAVTLQLMASYDGVTYFLIGTTQNVSAGNSTEQRAFLDSTTVAQLANPYPYMGVQVKASIAPASGTITVAIIAASV